MGRTAIAVLNTEHLLHNLNIIKGKSQHAPLIAMVKANAYGHGLRSTALRLEGRVAGFGVASIDEALALRKVGIKSRIMLMEGIFEQSELLIAACEQFEVVFHHEQQLKWLAQSDLPLPLWSWLKVDTGMGRLGFSMQAMSEAHQKLQACYVHRPIGIMSHLACADDFSQAHNNIQLEAFRALVKNYDGRKSLLNSAGIFNFPDFSYDLVRPGISLYGISPLLKKRAVELDLKPVMTLKTSLISVRKERQGTFIGYGSTYRCPRDMTIGIMAIGYGDGYPARENTPVLVNNKRSYVVGRISMDMAAIDLSSCPEARVGDSVTLWGDALHIEEISEHTGRSTYDLLCAVQSRVKFHWTNYKLLSADT